MTNRLELNWKLDGFVDEQRYYCSESDFTENSLPAPKVILDSATRNYVDTDIVVNKLYYVAISSVKNGIEKIGTIFKIMTSPLNFTIKSIFSLMEKGVAYNFQDITTMWQDIDRTIPVTEINQKIACIDDLSGNGNHLIQADSSKMPILLNDSYGFYLWLDGATSMKTKSQVELSGLTNFSLFTRLSKERAGVDEVVIESSENYNDNSGAFAFSFTPQDITISTKGAGGYPSGYNIVSTQIISDAVYSSLFNLNLSVNKIKLRINGTEPTITSRLDNTSSPLVNNTIFIGARSGSMYFTKTKMRSLILLGRTTTQTEIESIENQLLP